jgi:hypothetical protein
MQDFTHLNALESHLFNEEMRLQKAKTKGEKDLRAVFVEKLKREISSERAFLGLPESKEVTDEDLAAL